MAVKVGVSLTTATTAPNASMKVGGMNELRRRQLLGPSALDHDPPVHGVENLRMPKMLPSAGSPHSSRNDLFTMCETANHQTPNAGSFLAKMTGNLQPG